MMTGNIHDGVPAVFVASLVEQQEAMVTDIYALVDGKYTNVSLSNDSGTSIKTLRNSYLYAEDIDSDGVVELPSLLRPYTTASAAASESHIIRWYAMTSSGQEITKLYTYHNIPVEGAGWYLELGADFVEDVFVVLDGETDGAKQYSFHLYDSENEVTEQLLTIYLFRGSDRAEQAVTDNRFELLRTDSVTYAARLEGASAVYGITRDSLIRSFHLIHTQWKTGVT
jgi:hypothetical protein